MHFFFVPWRITLFPTARGPFYVSKYDSKFGGVGESFRQFPAEQPPPLPCQGPTHMNPESASQAPLSFIFLGSAFLLTQPPLPPGDLSHLIIVGRSKGTWCGGGWRLSMVFSSPTGIIIPHIMMVVVSHFTTC